MAWYDEWFNSKDYLTVYRHRDYTEAGQLVDLIEKQIDLKKGSSVLDMACGAGRHAIAFALKGYKVTAVDLSETLIAEAKNNSTIANVEIEFIQTDIRNLKSEVRFDLSVNLFTSFGYFETDQENFIVIQKAYDLLKPEGYFILDYFNKNYLKKNLVPVSKLKDNGTTIIQNRQLKENRIEKKITIERNNSINDFYESVRLYDFTELKSMFESYGFHIKKILGDISGNIFDENTSPRTIIFAQK